MCLLILKKNTLNNIRRFYVCVWGLLYYLVPAVQVTNDCSVYPLSFSTLWMTFKCHGGYFKKKQFFNFNVVRRSILTVKYHLFDLSFYIVFRGLFKLLVLGLILYETPVCQTTVTVYLTFLFTPC